MYRGIYGASSAMLVQEKTIDVVSNTWPTSIPWALEGASRSKRPFRGVDTAQGILGSL